MIKNSASDFAFELSRARNLVDVRLEHWLKQSEWHPLLNDDTKYLILGGGKALRPALLFFAFEQYTGSLDCLPSFAVDYALAVEMIHTYSLVHDDLPAMDNDDLRRGKPTLHKLYGDARAILTGDALLTAAFEVLSQANTLPQKSLIAVSLLSQAAGAKGMISGQMRDLFETQSVAQELSLEMEALARVHAEKTGALIAASLELGFLAASAPEVDRVRIRKWGFDLGLLFQVMDDILDFTQSTEQLGKTTGKDLKNQKRTYVSLLGITKAKEFSQNLAQSLRVTCPQFLNPQRMEALISMMLERKN